MEIPQIKTQLNIIELVRHYGYTPNRNNLIKCPFHEDAKPSLQLYPQTNTWYCFGCGKGTDGIDFIKEKEGCTTHEAINKAKALIPQQLIPNQKSPIPNSKSMTTKERNQALTSAFTYFARSINSTESPRQYLQKRALDLKKITVGYDAHNFHKSKEVSEELKQLYVNIGLLYPDKLGRANNYHSFFDGCVVFPIYNKENEIVNLYGRCINDTKESKHRYLPGKHQGIYPRYPKPETQTLIITESIIDAATLLQHKETLPYGIETTGFLAIYGVNNLTPEHAAALMSLKQLKEIIFFFDGDKAGMDAVKTHSKTLSTILPLVKIYYVETPEGEDINSLAQAYEPTIFAELLNKKRGINVPIADEPINQLPESPLPATDPGPKTLDSRLNTDNPEQLIFENDWLTATVWGGIELHNIKKLRATLHLKSKKNEYLEYRDTVDLYSYNNTYKLIRDAGERLEISTHQLVKTITDLTRSLENYRQTERDKERKREEAERQQNMETFTKEEMQQGEQLLKSKDLMQQTENHIKNIGLVGEEEKGMLLFFILLTRMFKEPLHALVQGQSGSGKTYLLKKIASLIPKAHIRITTALTENTLYHSLKDFWKHMILLIEDLDGAFGALLPLREMMSNQSISKFSTEKNLKTGEFEPKFLYVEGPICVAGATTKDSIYEDNANRSFLIQVNETAEHLEKVLEYQRKEIAGLMDKSKQIQAQALLKAAQLHLEPLEVVIPFGEELRIPDYVFKKLRTNAHYLTLIKAIAFWHQKQREIKQKPDGTRYIEATLDDVEWANKLSKEVLLRKSDELNGALRGFFESIKSWLQSEKSKTFYASQIRNHYRMHPQQLKRYLDELRYRGYIKMIGKSHKAGYEYEVSVWDDYEILKKGMDILEDILRKLRGRNKK